MLGGWLQNPVELYPQVFGPGSAFGGKDGVWWMKKYPYAFPNLLMAVLFVVSIALVVFGLEEVRDFYMQILGYILTSEKDACRPCWTTRLGYRFPKMVVSLP